MKDLLESYYKSATLELFKIAAWTYAMPWIIMIVVYGFVWCMAQIEKLFK